MQENKETAERDFCEIIQMKCPYDHDCHVCRLHSDYEKAREIGRVDEEKWKTAVKCGMDLGGLWKKIKSIEDFKGISKEDIENTWYVKLLKGMGGTNGV